MVLTVTKRCMVLLSVALVTISSAVSLEGTRWVSSDMKVEYSGVQLAFKSERVSIMFSCLNVQGSYQVTGTGNLQIQATEQDTLCIGTFNVVDVENYQGYIRKLNNVASFSITSDENLYLITGDNDSMDFRELNKKYTYPDELPGKWLSPNSTGYLFFFANSDIEIFDACNTYWKRYGIAGDSLYIEPGFGTMAACPGKFLEHPTNGTFVLDDNTLTITDSSMSYHYTRPSVKVMRQPERNTAFRRNTPPSGEETLFDCKGRAIRDVGGGSGVLLPAGIFFVRQGENAVLSRHVFPGTLR